jgi:hypothetical protein
MEPVQITILILQILVRIYGQDYNPEIDWFILSERSEEQIVFVGDFKGVDEVIICDNRLYDRCGLKNKQRILLAGQTQLLIDLDPYPFTVPERIYVHTLSKGIPTHLKGYEMRMGFVYDRIHKLK